MTTIVQNVISAVIGGLLIVAIISSYNWYSDRTIETDQVTGLSSYISNTYMDLCLYFGTQDHYKNFDPHTFVRSHITAMERILEPEFTKINSEKIQHLLIILTQSGNLIDNDIFVRADEQSDQIGDWLFSGMNHFEEIYFDNLRDLNWLQLPARECGDIKDFFLNSR